LGTESETRSPQFVPSTLTARVTRLLIVLLVGCLALGCPQAAVAQAPDATPSARELWHNYPLHATPEPRGAEVTPARAASSASPAPAQPARMSRAGLRTAVAAVLAILAFAVGFALAVRYPRHRAEQPATPPAPSARNGPEPPPPPAARAATSRPTLEPPARGRAWTAEIEWHARAGEGRFLAVARAADGDETATLVESESVAWPPSGDAGVPTLTTAAEELESRLVAAGWRPLPPGEAWYAKRFAWEPALWMPAGRFGRDAARSNGSSPERGEPSEKVT
jgi:hypothetical protein